MAGPDVLLWRGGKTAYKQDVDRAPESRMTMRLMAVAVAAAFAVCAVSAADAQTNRKRVARSYTPASTVVVHRDEQGRTRTKIIVQKRSYLDGGTEVMPGDNADTYRNTFLTHRATNDALSNNIITNPQGPIPDPFFLPGKSNPWPGFGY
jgi:hypothetical protein